MKNSLSFFYLLDLLLYRRYPLGAFLFYRVFYLPHLSQREAEARRDALSYPFKAHPHPPNPLSSTSAHPLSKLGLQA
jgi:hypothetical protein